MMDNRNTRTTMVLSLALVLAWAAAGCGSDRGGGSDTAQSDTGQPDPGMDIKPLDLTFDMVKPKDLSKDETAAEGVTDPGMEVPPKAPMPATAGDVLITEFMARSQPGSDKGEWLELLNATAGTLDLDGCLLGDDASDDYIITQTLRLEPGDLVVLARSDDPALNHGLTPDYVYNDFTLSNTEDEIVLTCGQVEIDRVAFTADWVEEGVATQLSSTAFDAAKNDILDWWCPATIEYGDTGKLGTPGEPNEECIQPDPCDPNPCTEPPAPECDMDGITLVTWQSPAPCTDVEDAPVCGDYPFTTTDCSLDGGQVCLEGACAPPPPPQPGLAGDILITEFMAKSQGGSDPGEWVELFNAGLETLDLGGCVLGDGEGDAHTIAGPMYVEVGQYAILAKGDDGFTADYLYTGFQLVNEGDAIILTCGAVEIDGVAFSDAWVVEGVAAQLSGTALDAASNDDPANWCQATAAYGGVGKLGTPGTVNEACPDLCEPNPCTGFPPAECDPDGFVLHAWTTAAPCTLAFGMTTCGEYPMDSKDCAVEDKICLDGACIDPCLPNPCTTFPAAACDGDGLTLLTYDTPAPCTNEGLEPVCGDYTATTFDCYTETKVCVDGACVVFDPCDPNPCTSSPEPACDPDGVTLQTWTSPGACTNVNDLPVCGEYPSDTFDCSSVSMICLEGACDVPQPGPPVAKGEVLITEFMAMSQGGLGDTGEWVELHNATDVILNLDGCVLGDNDADAHTLAGPILIAPGGALALARSDDPVENHGLVADYIYSGFQLSNTDDEIVLTCGATEIDRVDFTDAWVTQGVAIQLDVDAYDADLNDDVANWCAAKDEYGTAAKLGTPGDLNGDCPRATWSSWK